MTSEWGCFSATISATMSVPNCPKLWYTYPTKPEAFTFKTGDSGILEGSIRQPLPFCKTAITGSIPVVASIFVPDFVLRVGLN